jgi:hypothetical protein
VVTEDLNKLIQFYSEILTDEELPSYGEGKWLPDFKPILTKIL